MIRLAAPQVPSEGLPPEEALALFARGRDGHEALLDLARRARDHYLPEREVALCGILQARLGGCAEDCAFCCQSSHHQAVAARPRPLASEEELFARARQVAGMGARAFSVVCAGRALRSRGELDRICRVVDRVRSELGLEPCASLGRIDRRALGQLHDAGLHRYHHNLEAAPSFFGRVITTYELDESLDTLAAARDVGLELCSAGIFGMGESDRQRVELVELLRGLAVEGVPLNFLEPQPGTPLEGRPLLDPDEALRIVALHRVMIPAADVIVAAGRDLVLGDRNHRLLDAGANGLMVGDYVTTFGDELERDHAILRAAGCHPRDPFRQPPSSRP